MAGKGMQTTAMRSCLDIVFRTDVADGKAFVASEVMTLTIITW